jgi:hypothetical protein
MRFRPRSIYALLVTLLITGCSIDDSATIGAADSPTTEATDQITPTIGSGSSPTATATDQVTPTEDFLRATYDSAILLSELASTRSLKSVPLFEESGGFVTTDSDPSNFVDEITSPQITIFRQLDVTLDGVDQIGSNELTVRATSPTGSGKVCSLEVSFFFTDASQVASGPLSAGATMSALIAERGDEISFRTLLVGQDRPVDERRMDRSASLAEYSENSFVSTAPNGDAVSLSDSDLASLAELTRDAATCIFNGFNAEGNGSEASLAQLIEEADICQRSCILTSRVEVEQAPWGRVTVLTTISPQQTAREANIAIVNSSMDVVWRYRSDLWLELVSAVDGQGDSSGNLLYTVFDGENRGTVVIGFEPEEVVDFNSLPGRPQYDARFAHSWINDDDGDGTVEIHSYLHICSADILSPKTFHWDGADYTSSDVYSC